MQVPVNILNDTQCLNIDPIINPKIQVCGGEPGKMICRVINKLFKM